MQLTIQQVPKRTLIIIFAMSFPFFAFAIFVGLLLMTSCSLHKEFPFNYDIAVASLPPNLTLSSAQDQHLGIEEFNPSKPQAEGKSVISGTVKLTSCHLHAVPNTCSDISGLLRIEEEKLTFNFHNVPPPKPRYRNQFPFRESVIGIAGVSLAILCLAILLAGVPAGLEDPIIILGVIGFVAGFVALVYALIKYLVIVLRSNAFNSDDPKIPIALPVGLLIVLTGMVIFIGVLLILQFARDATAGSAILFGISGIILLGLAISIVALFTYRRRLNLSKKK